MVQNAALRLISDDRIIQALGTDITPSDLVILRASIEFLTTPDRFNLQPN